MSVRSISTWRTPFTTDPFACRIDSICLTGRSSLVARLCVPAANAAVTTTAASATQPTIPSAAWYLRRIRYLLRDVDPARPAGTRGRSRYTWSRSAGGVREWGGSEGGLGRRARNGALLPRRQHPDERQ